MFALVSRAVFSQTGKNGAWIIAGKTIIFLLSFALMAGFANLADKEIVGSYNYVIAILAIVSITTLPGMNTALIRAVSRGNEGSLRAMAHKKLLFGMIGSFLSIGTGVWYLLHGNTVFGYSFLIAAPFVALTDTVSDLAFAYWIGKKNYKKSMTLSIAYQAFFSIPSLAILFFTDSLIVIIFSFLFFQALSGFLVYRTIKPENTDRDIESEQFGVHLTIMSAFRIAGSNADKLLVWYLFGPISLAVYVIASTPIIKLDQLVPIEQIALPVLATQTATDELKRRLLSRMGLLFLLVLIPVFLLFLLAPVFYHLLFPGFSASIPLFRLLLVGLLFTPFYLLRTGLTAWKRQTDLYIAESVVPTAKIVLCLVGGLLFGLTGVVVGVIASRLIDSGITYALFRRAR